MVKDLPEDVAGVIWAKEVEDYQRFGVIVKDDDGFMKRIVEKPRDPVSKLANIGLYYIRDWKLLFEGIASVTTGPKAKGGEFYLTDAFQFMIDRGARIKVVEVEGWYDCGQVETLLDTNRHLLETTRERDPDGGVRVRVTSPVRVSEGVDLDNVELGPNVTVETGCKISNSKLRDTIMGENCVIENCELHDSIIGHNVTLRGVKGSVSVGDQSVVTS
jgi:glucose-1-phosphate thymidylyltransferase